jgi:hypothetical protein
MRYISKMGQSKSSTMGLWRPDQEAFTCAGCDIQFTCLRRRHHCRRCGEVVCQACSSHRLDLPFPDGMRSNQRVCIACYVPIKTKIYSLVISGLQNEIALISSMIEEAEMWRVCRDGVSVQSQPGVHLSSERDKKGHQVLHPKETLLFVLDQYRGGESERGKESRAPERSEGTGEHWLFHLAIESFEVKDEKIDLPVEGWSAAKIRDTVYCEYVSSRISREYWIRIWKARIFTRFINMTEALTVGRLVSPCILPDVAAKALIMAEQAYDRLPPKDE